MRSVGHWSLLAVAVSGLDLDEHELVAHLELRNLASFEKSFWEIADPDHDQYLRFMSREDIAKAIGASEADIASVRSWFQDMGVQAESIRVSPLRDTVTAKIPNARRTRLGAASLSELSRVQPAPVKFLMRREIATNEQLAALDSTHRREFDATSSASANSIKDAYGIPTDLMASNESTLQMVWGPGTFGYSQSKLSSFKSSQCPQLNMDKVTFDTDNHGTPFGDNYGEGNLDTTQISCFGLNVNTLVSNTNTSSSTEEGDGFGQALLDFLTELSSRETIPQVLSMSLGSLAPSSCDLLCSEAEKRGHTHEECHSFLQDQRQVCMFLSQAQVDRINTALQMLGVRGVTALMASGDGGSHFSFGKFSEFKAIGRTLNEVSCQYQMPVAPTSSPYLVGVGGETWSGSSAHPITWPGSGGGFSWQFAQPEHQKASVAAYLAKSGMPPASSFNATGRAYPDMAAVGNSGTSQAAPIAAGIFSMLNDHRLNAGLPPLGFVAPRLWKIAESFPGEAFFDITEGNSKGSCDNGFPATEGWDANTGWGRPVWEGMLKHFGSDDALRSSKVVV